MAPDASGLTALDRTPFGLLGASTRDDRRRIVELAEERSLTGDGDLCAKARADLCHPRHRVTAELAWLPGLSPSRVDAYRELLRTNLARLADQARAEAPLVRANLMAATLERLGADVPLDNWVDWILELARQSDEIAPEDVRRALNEDRAIAGFPEVPLEVIDEELRERRRRYGDTVKAALDRLETGKMLDVIAAAVETATAAGSRAASVLIDELVDGIDLAVRPYLDREAENLTALVDAIRQAAGRGDAVIAPTVDRLDHVLRCWNRVARPLQVSMAARGLRHEKSHEVSFAIRSLAVDLCNQHDLVSRSQGMVAVLQEVFAAMPEATERLAEDARALASIVADREAARQQAEAFAKDMTYEATVGRLFKSTLRISLDGVEWKGTRLPLESITHIGWGATRHSVNGVPTGTSYHAFLGSAAGVCTVNLRRQDVFSEFVERLWKTVGVRLLNELLRGLRDGQRYAFGDAVVDDTGIQLRKRRLFRAGEHIYSPWLSVRHWSADGSLFVANRDEPKAYLSLPYQAANNAHVLEAAVRAVLEKPADRMSHLLGA
jgi:hypothetical protein